MSRFTVVALLLGALLGALLGGCATAPDHFHALSVLPATADAPPGARTGLVRLNTSIPAIDDRPEMVLNGHAPGTVVILEHERWAAPLAEQVTDTLARDLERRRADWLVGDRRFERADQPAVDVQVDIIEMRADRGGHALLRARWRVRDPSGSWDVQEGGTFESSAGGDGGDALAPAYSALLSALAERLAAALPVR